jgi:hypothetical protein
MVVESSGNDQLTAGANFLGDYFRAWQPHEAAQILLVFSRLILEKPLGDE